MGLNLWPRDTSAMLYQLSYEAIDIGSRSIEDSYVPMREMNVNDIWNNSYVNCGNEMKKWLSQWTQFMQLHKEPVWTRDLEGITGLSLLLKSNPAQLFRQ